MVYEKGRKCQFYEIIHRIMLHQAIYTQNIINSVYILYGSKAVFLQGNTVLKCESYSAYIRAAKYGLAQRLEESVEKKKTFYDSKPSSPKCLQNSV